MVGTQSISIGVLESILCGCRARINFYLVYFHTALVLVELESDRIPVFSPGIQGSGRSLACDIDWINPNSSRLGSTQSGFSLDPVARQPVSLLALLAHCLEHGAAHDCLSTGAALE